MSTQTQPDNLLRGVLLVILAEAVLVVTGIVIRTLGENLAVAQLVFLRNAVGLLFIVPLTLSYHSVSVRTSRIHLHFLRALIGVTAMACLYYGWTHLPLGTAALLKQTGPLWMPVMALWLLRESIPKILRWSLPIGFAGVALVLQPSSATLQFAVLIGLLGAILSVGAKIVIRKMKDTEPSRRIVFYFTLFAAILSFPLAAMDWQWLTLNQWLGVAAIAGLSTVAQLSLTQAYHSAPAGYLGPFTYSSVAIATLLGWMLWDETLDILTMLGMLLILAGGVLTLRGKSA